MYTECFNRDEEIMEYASNLTKQQSYSVFVKSWLVIPKDVKAYYASNFFWPSNLLTLGLS